MSKFIDLSNQVFGRLTAKTTTRDSKHRLKWVCDCTCGGATTVAGSDLRRGVTKSCGCLSSETTAVRNTTHGESDKTPEYKAWKGIKGRTTCPTNSRYEYYGGRGISMCGKWRNNYGAFLADMGRRPSATHSIDRINNDGDYSPDNCRWATKEEQSNNQRTTKLIAYEGETLSHSQWSRRLGSSGTLVKKRIRRGWSEKEAVSVKSGHPRPPLNK